jgi:uncharacterized protein YbcV (DUF1398 family)
VDENVKRTVEDCTALSDNERISFGEVVMKLFEAGIERYHADLSRSDKIYYLPSGESHRVKAAPVGPLPARVFSPVGVAAAVRSIQQKRIGYKGFCEQIAEAGCVGYIVSLAGRRAVYYGRDGESYVEPFPNAA